jgi:telomerase Cajal body protein 1
LWDAYTGSIRATYSPINLLDEMESPTVVNFIHNGQRLIAGGFRTDRQLQLFDMHRPGKVPYQVFKLGKTRRSKDGQKGLVSSIATNAVSNTMAVGTFAPGSIYLYDDRCQSSEEQASILMSGGTCIVGHGRAFGRKAKHYQALDEDLNFKRAKILWYQDRARPGVTQLEFSPTDPYTLFSTSRRSNAVLQWDLRKLTSGSGATCGVGSFATVNDTNQRLEFHVSEDSKHLWVGGQDCNVRIYSIASQKLISKLTLPDVANGVSLNKAADKVACACGTRRFPTDSDLDQDTFDESNGGELRLYKITSRY